MILFITSIAVLGFIVWALTTLVPMPAPFKSVIYGLACLLLLIIVLGVFGFGPGVQWYGGGSGPGLRMR